METEFLIRAILSLIFVVALIGIIAVLFQKLAIEKKLLRKDQNRKLKILEYQMLDSKRRLALIEYDKKELLLLLGPHGEKIITESDLQKATNTKKKK